MTKHQWREDIDGEQLYYRATHHAGQWNLYSQTKEAESWTHHDPIPVELLEKLRLVVWNKYQRGRCPHKFVKQLDKMLGKD